MPTGRDLEIEITPRAYLIEAIPFQMYSKFYGCTYTYEIWEALNQEYSYRSCEDQLRLELELTMIRKMADKNLDKFIERFEKLSALYKDQNPNCLPDRLNSYFLLCHGLVIRPTGCTTIRFTDRLIARSESEIRFRRQN